MSFNCKRCGGELDVYKAPDIPVEDKILIQPCSTCEKKIRDGAMNYAWQHPHTEDMGR
jgi:hypothetical protein